MAIKIILGKKYQIFMDVLNSQMKTESKKKGFLISLKPNGKGQWRILKAYS